MVVAARPSFRRQEVLWENVDCSGPNGECVSKSGGTHLGHNIPDDQGDRLCINLSCIAGRPAGATVAAASDAARFLAARHGTAAAAGAGAGADNDELQVYFGAGCFWHVQQELAKFERSVLGRTDLELTARAGYAGGSPRGGGGAEGQLVCYHPEGADGAVADYAEEGQP